MATTRHTAVLELTFNCNFTCKFCYAPWLEDSSFYGKELDIAEWIKIADNLIEGGVRHLTLSGGEPLLKADVSSLIDFLIRHPAQPKFTIYTNGSLIDDAMLTQLKSTKGRIACSLPGMEVFRELTGANMSAGDMFELFGKLQDANIPFSVAITVTKPTLKEFRQMVPLALLSGADVVQVQPFLVEGRGRFHPELALSYADIVRLKAWCVELGKLHPVTYADEMFCSCRKTCVKPEGLPEGYIPPSCTIEQRLIVISPTGRYRKCLHTLRESDNGRSEGANAS
ncbi:MAG: radical SAM protein [Desulfomonile sp.]